MYAVPISSSIYRSLTVALFCLLGTSQFACSQSSTANTLNVLFVGNSYIYFNNLPDILEAIAESKRGVPIFADHHTHGGHMLYEHFEDGHLEQYLHDVFPTARKWDYVVLQEQSTLGVGFRQADLGMLGDPADEFLDGVNKLHGLISEREFDMMLFMTWAKQPFPDQTSVLASAYDKIGDDFDMPVAPVGLAFARVKDERPDIELYLDDGSHPAPAGSYLAACVFYAQLTGDSPVGASGLVQGTAWDRGDIILSGELTTLVDLDAETAKYLQQVAWDIVAERDGK